MRILEIRKSHIFYINDNGEVKIEPNTPYFKTKLVEFSGDRISKYFPIEGIMIQETFDEMIFNITFNETVVTTRPHLADMIVEAFNDPEKIIEIVNKYNSNSFNVSLIENFLEKYGERVKVIDIGFVVDDLFLVDRNGTAYNWKDGKKNSDVRTNLSNGGICIVVKNVSEKTIFDEHRKQQITIDPLAFTVLSKIEFLLSPNTKDVVFMDQLPKETVEILQRQESEKTFVQSRLQ